MHLGGLSFGLLALSALAFAPAHAQGADCFYLIPDQPLTLEAVQAREGWQPVDKQANFGYLQRQLWLRCAVEPANTFLSVQNPIQKRFTVHYRGSNGQSLGSKLGGRTTPASTQDATSPEHLFSLPSGTAEVFIQDGSAGPKNYPLALLTQVEAVERNAQIATIHGVYYGIITILALYALAAAYLTRQPIYAWYAAYAASLMAFLANKDGFGRAHIWTDLGPVLEYWPGIWLAITLVVFSRFADLFLNARRHHPLLTRALYASLAVHVGAVLGRLLTDHYVFILLEPYLAVAVCMLFLTIGVLRAKSGSTMGKVFVAGNACVLAGTITYALTITGVIGSNLIIEHSVHIGSLMEVLVFSTTMGLLARHNELRAQRTKRRTEELRRRVQQLQSASQLAEEHRSLQRTLHNAQKQRTVGQMAAGIGHEFNNILASILGFAELALQRLEDRMQLVRYLEEIRHAGDRASDLVRQLLLYSRGDPQRTSDLDLPHTVAEACNLLRSSLPPSVRIEFDVSRDNPPPARVHMNAQSLQQLVINLCLNASEAMRERGVVRVTLRSSTVSERLCTSCMERFSGTFTVLEVVDTGPGIAGNANKLFEPFHTTKAVGSGSGLGLSVVHGIVHETGGHVQLTNQAQSGMRAALFLQDAPVQAIAAQAPRILLIESNPTVSSYLETLLHAEALDVTTTGGAADALEQFMRSPNAFDLVIADEALPHGSAGELAEDLLALKPELPIIITARDEEAAAEMTREVSGIGAVISKPLDGQLLMAKVRSLLKSRTVGA